VSGAVAPAYDWEAPADRVLDVYRLAPAK